MCPERTRGTRGKRKGRDATLCVLDSCKSDIAVAEYAFVTSDHVRIIVRSTIAKCNLRIHGENAAVK